MKHRTRTAVPSFLDPASFCDQVFEWLEDFSPLFEGLAFVRQLDGEEAAVEALLETRELKRLRVSWELWEALTLGDGSDPEQTLVPYLGDDLYAWIRFALWGVTLPAPKSLRLVPPSTATAG